MMGVSFDHDGYWRADAGAPATVVDWWNPMDVAYPTVMTFQTATGNEAHAVAVDGIPDPFFQNPDAGDYSQASGSPAQAQGAALPANVAAALGVTSATPVNIGAY